MLFSLAVLFLHQGTSVAQISEYARTRDIEQLREISAPDLLAKRPQSFTFLRIGGAYGTGRFGWKVEELKAPNGKRLLVFTTKITSQDIGEQVFEWNGTQITSYLDERDSLGVKIKDQSLRLSFKAAEKHAFLVADVEFEREKRADRCFILRMSPQYKFVSVMDSKGQKLRFQQVGGITCLPVPKEAKFKYTVRYDGIVDLPGYAGSVTAKEAMMTNDYWYPMIARQPSPYTLTVTVPQNWTTMGQGEVEDARIEGAVKIVRYRMDLPAVYYSFSAGEFKRVETEIDGRKYVTLSRNLTEEQLQVQNGLQAQVIEFYQETFGGYPFTRWGAVDTDLYGGGALEAYSYATYGTGWLPAEDGHEPVHTWWGGIIPNTYLNSLWNEGFADFCDQFYRREVERGSVSERRLAFIADANPESAYMAAPLAQSGSDIGPASSTLGYGKGAAVMQMLEQELGTATLVKAMRYWLQVHPKGVPGEWEHFEKAVNESTRKDYKWFFDQWVRRKGWAEFAISNVSWKDGEVRGDVLFTGEPYNLQLDALLEYPDGSREFVKTRIGGASKGLVIPVKQKPALVSLDPWRRILRKAAADEYPIELRTYLAKVKRFTEPAHEGWLSKYPARTALIYKVPEDLNNTFLVGSPETLPAMKELCDKVGFAVKGDSLTYKGTTINLNQGAAMAVVDLGGGKRCAIGLGKTMLTPDIGRAKLALVDNYGRFLRGVTNPKTSGNLTFKL